MNKRLTSSLISNKFVVGLGRCESFWDEPCISSLPKLLLASQPVSVKVALGEFSLRLHHYLSSPQWAMILCFNWHHVSQFFSHICYLTRIPRSLIIFSWVFSDLINDISTTHKLSDFNHFTCFVLAFIVMATKQFFTCGKQNQFYLDHCLTVYEARSNLSLIMCGLKMKVHKLSWRWDYRLFQQRKLDLINPSFLTTIKNLLSNTFVS